VPSQGKDQELTEFAEPVETPPDAVSFREALRERLWQWLGRSGASEDESDSSG